MTKNKLQVLVEQVRELERKMQEDGKNALHGAFREFFETHPAARAVVWTQYTPYFNDGDACTFRVNSMELKADRKSIAPTAPVVFEGRSEDDDEDEEEDDEYGYGDSCDAYTISKLEDCSKNRKYNKQGTGLRALTPEEKSLVTDFYELSGSCEELDKVLEMTFGDHVKVVATRDGFDVQDYDHD